MSKETNKRLQSEANYTRRVVAPARTFKVIDSETGQDVTAEVFVLDLERDRLARRIAQSYGLWHAEMAIEQIEARPLPDEPDTLRCIYCDRGVTGAGSGPRKKAPAAVLPVPPASARRQIFSSKLRVKGCGYIAEKI